MKTPESAQVITSRSKSNLALAFVALDPARRRDITTFYAFCRLVDDIADEPGPSVAEKQAGLDCWRRSLHGPTAEEPPLAVEVRALMTRYPVTPAMFEEIVDGVEMDLRVAEYGTFEELRLYCYRVASAVGLISIEIFGYKNPQCREYAVELGLALQMTNIIRDVGKDLENGRIYLPREDMARWGYSAAQLRERVHNEEFVRLMRFEAERAHAFYGNAVRLLPPEDRRAMVAAEIMRSTYHALLRRIEAGGFRVFDRVHSLGKAAKLFHISRHLLGFG